MVFHKCKVVRCKEKRAMSLMVAMDEWAGGQTGRCADTSSFTNAGLAIKAKTGGFRSGR